jgi:hypothetical protein
LNNRFVSETADLWFGRRIGVFFSALEIPFPGNGDRRRRRLSSNGEPSSNLSEWLLPGACQDLHEDVLALPAGCGGDVYDTPSPPSHGMIIAVAASRIPCGHGISTSPSAATCAAAESRGRRSPQRGARMLAGVILSCSSSLASRGRRQLCKRRRRASLSLPPPSLTRWRQRLGEEQPAVQVR